MESFTCADCQLEFEREIQQGRKRYCTPCVQNRARARCKAYKAKNREKVKIYNSKYKAEHKAYTSAYNSAYDKKNRKTIQARQTIYQRKRRVVDPGFRISHSLRNRLGGVIKRKTKGTMKYLDMCHDVFILWMEFKFDDSMTMDNYGTTWHIDHVIPVSLFDLTDDCEVEKAFHWTNTQPMLAAENMSKGNKITKAEILEHSKYIKKFITMCTDGESISINMIVYDKFQYVNS